MAVEKTEVHITFFPTITDTDVVPKPEWRHPLSRIQYPRATVGDTVFCQISRRRTITVSGDNLAICLNIATVPNPKQALCVKPYTYTKA